MSYFLYRHIRPDLNVPFYIGIGTKRDKETSIKKQYHRAFHINGKYRSRSTWWERVFNVNNGQIDVEIMFESDNLSDIQAKEKEFISLYGRRDNNKGTLVNLTDGGEGVFGLKMSDENKRKMSERQTGKPSHRKGIKSSEETKEKIRQANLGKKQSEETKMKKSLATKGRVKSAEHLRKIIESNKNRDYSKQKRTPCSEAKKAKLRISLKGKNTGPQTKEHIKKRRIGLIIYRATTDKIVRSPETIEKLRIINTGRKCSDETKAKMSSSRKKFLNEHPIYREIAIRNLKRKKW